MLKSNESSINPCGTPAVTSTKLEYQLLYTTYCFQTNQYFFINKFSAVSQTL